MKKSQTKTIPAKISPCSVFRKVNVKNSFLLLVFFVMFSNANLQASENNVFTNFDTNYVGHANYFVDNDVKNTTMLIGNLSHANKEIYHLFTHGKSGELLIKGSWLNAQEIALFLKKKLKSQKIKPLYLNIYGCEFAKGKKGTLAIKYIEQETGLKVAASTNITGKDGDWVLEYGASKDAVNIPLYRSNLQAANTGLDDDFDGDNVINRNDLDKDNDGITDAVECPVDLGESNFNNWDNPTSNWTLPASGAFIRNVVDNVVSPITFTQDGFTGLTEIEFTFSVRGSNKSNSSTSTSFNDLFFTINGVDYIEWENTTDTAPSFPISGNINISNGAQVSPATFEVNSTGFNEYTVVIPWDVTEDEAVIEFRQGPGGEDDFLVNAFSFSRETLLHFCADTDNDGFADNLDTDSDDDGCPDAVEGAGDFTSDQLTVLSGGSVTANSSSDNFGTTVSSDTATLGVPTQNSATPAVAVSLPQGTTSAVLDNADATACNADLNLVKIVDKSIVKVNDKIIYTLTVTNSGPNSTTDVEITDALPTGLTYLSSGSGTDVPTGTTYNATPNVWVIGDMALDETRVLKLEATVNTPGSIVNMARVSKSSEVDSDSDPTNTN